MDDELALFALDDDQDQVVEEAPAPIATWQIDLLRKALDVRGLSGMRERQQLIEELAGRTVASLRELTGEEGLKILARLGDTPTPKAGSGSTWDERDEDTWIDRL